MSILIGVGNKFSESLAGLLHKVKRFLNTKVMRSLYYSLFHSYLSYGNIAWCSTTVSKLKKTFQQIKTSDKDYFCYNSQCRV